MVGASTTTEFAKSPPEIEPVIDVALIEIGEEQHLAGDAAVHSRFSPRAAVGLRLIRVPRREDEVPS